MGIIGVIGVMAVACLAGPQPLLQPDILKARVAERARAERQAAALVTFTNSLAKAKDLAAVTEAVTKWAAAEKVEKEVEAKKVSASAVEAVAVEGPGK